MLIEALEVLSTKNIDKYLNSRYEVIKTMATEIKKVNDSMVDHMNSVMQELAELRHDMDLGSSYREGHKEGLKEGHETGLKEGLKKGTKEIISTLYKSGLTVQELAKRLNMSEEEVENLLKQ